MAVKPWLIDQPLTTWLEWDADACGASCTAHHGLVKGMFIRSNEQATQLRAKDQEIEELKQQLRAARSDERRYRRRYDNTLRRLQALQSA